MEAIKRDVSPAREEGHESSGEHFRATECWATETKAVVRNVPSFVSVLSTETSVH